MSQLQVTKITTVDNTTPLILATGNAGGGQIIIQSSNTDVFFNGNLRLSSYVTGDGSGLFLPTSNVANAAYTFANSAYASINSNWTVTNTVYDVANAAFASANNVAPQVTPAYNTANSAFNTANAAFASANNVAPQVTPSYNTANAAFNTANAAFASANNVGPQIAPTYNTANSAFATANLASNTATGAYNTANAAYNNANAAFNAANTKFSSSGGTISGAVEITADLTVHGNTRFIDQQTLSVGDPLIYLAANNYSSDVVDIGFVANYVNATSANVHTGLYRSSGTKEYYLFYGYDKEPYNNYIDPTGNNIQQAVLNSTLRTSNVILGGANAINWITAAFAKANASGANVGQTAPTGVTSGKLWWNSDLGKLFVYYTDPANTSSWIETSPSASAIEGSIITGYINPVFNTVNASYTFANSAYASINSNWTVTNAAYGQVNTNTTTLTAAYGVANAGFGKANTALQNTSGTFSGTLTVTGNLVVGTGTTTISNNSINVSSILSPTGTVNLTSNLDLSSSTSHIKLPIGTTAQRPVGTAGMIRFNSTLGQPEWYDSTATTWSSFNVGPQYYIEYLVIGGGGAGGNPTGGGGAGGYRSSVIGESSGGGTSAESRLLLLSGSSYAITVGAGGSGVGYPLQGNPGSSSSFAALVVSNGGGSGTHNGLTGNSNGGSGGGGGYSDATGGTGTSGQGYGGGGGSNGGAYPGGGGGGAGSAGGNSPNTSTPGNGGTGVYSSITGSSVGRAGGGGGGSRNANGSSASEGGGAGSSGSGSNSGTSNTGGGGGGGGYSSGTSGNGGSGVVIIRYAGSQRGSGGTVTSSGGYTIHTFTSSGTFTA